ncbi:Permease of the drug/metabolite transporter (DMT) superfamily [Rhizobium sp. NFR07]|uniref:DMT family transporter n=1 Tax=Rhizobium sp. NFR07 TaxID=1566262 RepID=UPI0008ED8954|nr:DMT family transporter [Rhizobium sp. NFR07]SFB63031.1 Permease of the drug/metabolite transporter (DMT) superfamily [Rhizobium sp. NFR07]
MRGRNCFSLIKWRDVDPALSRHSLGLLLVAAAAVAWSTGGFFFRLIDLDPWTTSFWRSLFAAALLAAYALFERRQLGGEGLGRAEIRRGIVISAGIAVSMTSFLPALALTSVANVALIYATAPILTAALAFLWLDEPFDRITIACSLAVIAGGSLMLFSSESASSNLGDLLALVSTMSLALVALAIRAWRPRALGPFMCLANIGVAAIAFLAAPSLWIDGRSTVLLVGFGFIQVTLSFTLFSLGARLLPARETALVNAVEGPLSPLWVWLAFGERPSFGTVMSGIVITAAVSTYLLLGTRPSGAGLRRRSHEAVDPAGERYTHPHRTSEQANKNEGP